MMGPSNPTETHGGRLWNYFSPRELYELSSNIKVRLLYRVPYRKHLKQYDCIMNRGYQLYSCNFRKGSTISIRYWKARGGAIYSKRGKANDIEKADTKVSSGGFEGNV